MAKKILIFRTDRVGDLIVSCPPILTIKEYFNQCNITLIASNKNSYYAKNLNLFNRILIFPETNIFKKLKFILDLRKEKFDYIFIFDGKEKSFLSAFFLNSYIKVGISTKIKKYFNLLNIKIFKFDNNKMYEVFQKTLNYSNINKQINNYDFISKKKNNNFISKIPINNFLQIHLDEKWFSNFYINNYTNICPSYNDFILFLKKASKYNNILITTGLIDLPILIDLKNKFLTKLENNIYLNNKLNNLIYLIDKPTYFDIESIMSKTKLLIICHGSLTHVANSFNIRIVDIIEESKRKFYFNYTYYINNYSFLYRSQFNVLQKFLLDTIEEEK
ncbi:hypothetical protein OAH88_01885 [Candidatus Pelagibacter sp.]|nr:hypothetical protein [Candidatus Pelagibacter sp.]